MTTPFNVTVAERRHKDHCFHYMRVDQYNAYGELICRWRFKSWK